MNIEIQQKDEHTSWEELVNLFKESFQERLDQGLNFICSFYTPEELERRSANKIVLVATDKDNGNLVGTATISIIRKPNKTWAYHSNLAVKPEYKRYGVGTKLMSEWMRIAESQGCEYIKSDTAELAASSVSWHKKNGFYPVSLHTYWNANYYSIIFRKQLKHHWFWSNPGWCAMRYSIVSTIYKSYRKSDNSLTTIGKLIFFFKNKR